MIDPLPGITIGIFKIHYYGVILMLGAMAGSWLASREAKRRGQDPEIVWDALLWVLILAIIGSRLWHIFTPPPSSIAQGDTTIFYLTHPLDAISVWEGGLGIPGGVIGGVLGLYIYARRKGLSFTQWLDIGAPGLALGQAIGRWGNFVNQELYGAPTDLPWAVHIEPRFRVAGYENNETFHPLFLYESLWSLGLMGLLLYLGRRFPEKLKSGDLFLVYLIGYPVGRFLLEFLRLDASQIGGFNANQTIMAVIAVAAAIGLFLRHRRESDPTPND